jgi:2-methylisocitrate lyase-like PEP mutase family enzyme
MTAEAFRALHYGPTPLVLPNAWEPVSARVVAEAGYPAIATSSAAVARVLGYDDGQQTPRPRCSPPSPGSPASSTYL